MENQLKILLQDTSKGQMAKLTKVQVLKLGGRGPCWVGGGALAKWGEGPLLGGGWYLYELWNGGFRNRNGERWNECIEI